MTRTKRWLALALCALMLVTTLPTAAFAAAADPAGSQDPAYASLLPLEEHRFTADLSRKLPEELKSVPVKELFEGSEYTIKDTDMVSWAKGSSSGSLEFTTIPASGTMDLSTESYSGSSLSLVLIVGTADQLNPDNVRYLVNVNTGSFYDLIAVDVYDTNRQKIDVYDCNLGQYRYDDEAKFEYNVSVDPKRYEYEDEVYVAMRFGERWKDAGLTAAVYEGYYETAAELPATDITSTIWDQADLGTSGGVLGKYNGVRAEDAKPFTLVLKRGETVALVLPFYVDIYQGNISVSTSTLHAREEDGMKDVEWSSDWEGEGDTQVEIVTLDEGYKADGTYYLSMYLYNPARDNIVNSGIEDVKAAYVGKYDTEEAAAGQTDIKEQLFSSDGYGTHFENGVTFTVFDVNGGVHQRSIKTKEQEATTPSEPAEPVLSSGVNFSINSVYTGNDESSYSSREISSGDDSYSVNGFQTLFVLDRDGSPVTENAVNLHFYSSDKSSVFLGENAQSGKLQEDHTSGVTLQSGEPLAYTVAAENGKDTRNYWVTLLTQQSGPKLYVNGINVDSLKDEDTGLPVREIFLSRRYDGEYHDIAIANIGDQPLTGLKVELTGAQNVKLDDYWTVNPDGVRQLAAFDEETMNTDSGRYLNNTAKIRLLPDGEGEISGNLTISADNGDSVTIKLVGFAGDPKIVTTSVLDGVKWVPYSSIIQTNYMYGTGDVNFTLADGTLPEGVIVKPNGEIYGVPQEMGEFTFSVTAKIEYNSNVRRRSLSWNSSAEYTLVIKENTNENVWNATDPNYGVLTAVPNTDGSFTISVMSGAITGEETALVPYRQNSWANDTQMFVSNGAFENFIDLWLDGEKLAEGTDYEKDPGSTALTIFTQTLNKSEGIHTLSMEFREGDKDLGLLKRAAQNYEVKSAGSSSSSGLLEPPTSIDLNAPANPTTTEDATTDTTDDTTTTETLGGGEYTVAEGDTLWGIAQRRLGSGYRWTLIYDANRDKIQDPNHIYIGQRLVIPVVTR